MEPFSGWFEGLKIQRYGLLEMPNIQLLSEIIHNIAVYQISDSKILIRCHEWSRLYNTSNGAVLNTASSLRYDKFLFECAGECMLVLGMEGYVNLGETALCIGDSGTDKDKRYIVRAMFGALSIAELEADEQEILQRSPDIDSEGRLDNASYVHNSFSVHSVCNPQVNHMVDGDGRSGLFFRHSKGWEIIDPVEADTFEPSGGITMKGLAYQESGEHFVFLADKPIDIEQVGNTLTLDDGRQFTLVVAWSCVALGKLHED